MSWESPIYITDRIVDYQTKTIDNMIVADVRKIIETHIDKEALLDALNGSREQYEKGYTEGRNYEFNKNTEMWEKIKTEISCISTHFWACDNTLAHKSSAGIIQECIEIINKYMEVKNDT